jgi:hypothetical protein
MQRTDWMIYGAGISALVLAERLGSAGNRVTLINPSRSWGGIFGGICIDGDIYDAGMTNFEFDLFGEPSNDILNYHPDRKPDVGRYVHFVKDYLARFVETEPLATPRMQFGTQVVNDLIISNHFDILALLAPAVRMAIRTELERIIAAPNSLHPRTKSEPDSPLITSSFESVSLANHGQTFHNLLIEPMFRKVLGIPSAEIAGVFHRNGWVPLFYPESLLSQFGPSPQSLKPTLFHYPKDVNFGGFVGKIADAVRRLPNVKIVDAAKDVEIDLIQSTIRVGFEEFPFQRLAWGGDIGQLTNTFDKARPSTKRADLDLFFLKVKDEGVTNRFTVLLDPEKISPFYRVTNQSICAGAAHMEHKIILECNSHNWDEASPDKSRILDAALSRYGIDPKALVSCHRRSFKGALAIPSSVQMTDFNRQRQYVEEAFPEVELIGASSGYVSVTLNDHIIQALKIAHREGAHT